MRVARGCLLALIYPIFAVGAVAAIHLGYLLVTGQTANPSLKWEAVLVGFLFWFLFPVVLLSRYTALGYWWTVGAFALPFAATLAFAVREGLAHGASSVLAWLLFSFLLGVPLGLLLRARRAYFTRLRLIQESPR